MSKSVKTVHYLGSKKRMLRQIKEQVDILNPNKGKVCDLFCGSGVVSEYLHKYYDLLSVDIQNYSKVYCDARLSDSIPNINVLKIKNEIQQSVVRQSLLKVFSPLLEYEEKAMDNLKKGCLEALYEIIEKGSFYAYIKNLDYSKEPLSPALERIFESVKLKYIESECFRESAISRLYGGLYFSYKQAIDIDSIASYAFSQQEPLRSKILASLMGATTDVVNTVGKQFAQPLKVTNKNGSLKKNLVKKIISDRGIDVFDKFNDWMEYYQDTPKSKNTFEVICDDYENVLKKLKPGEVEVVYADPPYTRYHYSRYYHILETICLHDNPDISTTFPNGKGGVSRAIYRSDRHQSPFSIKSKAPVAFDTLFRLVKDAKASLVLSYSPFEEHSSATPRLLTIEDLVSLAEKYFTCVKVVSPGQFMHSRFNKQENNYEINYEAEKLIVCKE